MGKKNKALWKHTKPSLEDPVCPTCGRRDKLFEQQDAPMLECDRCMTVFWIEEREEEEGEGSFGTKCTVCLGRGCKACLPSGPKSAAKSASTIVRQTDPVVGKMLEITDDR